MEQTIAGRIAELLPRLQQEQARIIAFIRGTDQGQRLTAVEAQIAVLEELAPKAATEEVAQE